MSTRVLLVLAGFTTLPALAQDSALGRDLQAGEVRQVSVTQAHLMEAQPQERKSQSPAPVVARLVGKLLSEQVKGVSVELSQEPDPAVNGTEAGLQDTRHQWHFNRRAEICYENYRVSLKRGGLAMRYELSF